MSAPRVLIVDDSAFMRSRIHREVTSAGMEVAGEARSGQEGVEMYRSLRPDLVTMDLTMRGDDGLTATRGILAIDPGARVVLFSIVDDPEMVKQALAAGIKAYVHKSRPADLIEKLRSLVGVAA